ncbi:MAG: M24 family metallopeptidase [Anaerolineae bacterium]|nr:M24 family metallopeptidase [Anaerolineae bacterium]
MQQPIQAYANKILPLHQQQEIVNKWLSERLKSLIPQIMGREKVDIWLVIAREYNEDPVVMTLLPRPAMSARRRTILLFARNPDDSMERLTVSRYGFEDFYKIAWNPDEEEQYECLARIIRERDPQSIAINFSEDFAFGDGLTHSEYNLLAAALGETYTARLCSAERLCLGWLETRLPAELDAYPSLVEMGHALIAEAFSTCVIHPGITTTDDLIWWMRQTMHDLGLQAWFQPNVEIQAQDNQFADFYSGTEQRKVILPGDLLWCDVGFYYLGLATDQQQHAYVLKPGETDAPAGLKAALADGNRLQNIHMEMMQIGKTGNQVLRDTLEKACAEGINATVYSHPLGYHGHAAGPTIGLWDQQGGVPGRGDYELFDHTCYSIELNIKKTVPEWGNQEVRIALEEDAVLANGTMRWLSGRQTALHLIG